MISNFLLYDAVCVLSFFTLGIFEKLKLTVFILKKIIKDFTALCFL